MVALGNQVGSNPGKRVQMKIDNIFYIIKSAIISVPSNTWQRSFRTTLHSRQSQFIRFNRGYGGVFTVSLNSTQRASIDAGVKTPPCPHLSSQYIAYRYYNQLISRSHQFHNNYPFPLTFKSGLPKQKSKQSVSNILLATRGPTADGRTLLEQETRATDKTNQNS